MLVKMLLKKIYRNDTTTCGVLARRIIGIKGPLVPLFPLRLISSLTSAVPNPLFHIPIKLVDSVPEIFMTPRNSR